MNISPSNMPSTYPMHPIVLNRSQFDADDVVQRFECDCACADRAFELTTPPMDANHPLRQPWMHMQNLPGDFTLLFNPKQSQGVAVVPVCQNR